VNARIKRVGRGAESGTLCPRLKVAAYIIYVREPEADALPGIVQGKSRCAEAPNTLTPHPASLSEHRA
jgi:hypothetical protein